MIARIRSPVCPSDAHERGIADVAAAVVDGGGKAWEDRRSQTRHVLVALTAGSQKLKVTLSWRLLFVLFSPPQDFLSLPLALFTVDEALLSFILFPAITAETIVLMSGVPTDSTTDDLFQ
jgi:hypothetical protein